MEPMTGPNCDAGSMRAPILLVDDTPANLLGLQAILAASDHELVGVGSGPEALAQLETREFAVVLLDLQMPVMDGVETALKIRQLVNAHGHTVPIIFLTATDATVPRVLTAYASGAVDFIQKPLQPEILRSKVLIFADLYRAKQRLVVEIEQRRRLEDALRARDELLAIVSHDLRNPLNAVLLGAHQIESAAEDRDWARARKAAGIIAKAVDRMSRLVGDLLDLATLDAGKPLAMNVAQHDLADLVLEISELLEPLAQSNQVTLKTDLSVATYVLCDRNRVQQVLSNLIGNAIKFTRRRGVIDVAASGRHGEVVVSVRDTGVGMHVDQVPRIFEPYWKADPERGSGAGLGLSIARAIVEAHGGRIWVETEAGSGSSFYFTLRAADASAAAHDGLGA
jgi:two-component system sensor histidine kinase/response regulator